MKLAYTLEANIKIFFSSRLRKKKKDNRILFDVYHKNINFASLPESQKPIYALYKWLYDRELLREISFMYKLNKDAVVFAFDIDSLFPLLSFMVYDDVFNIEQTIDYLFDKHVNHKYLLRQANR